MTPIRETRLDGAPASTQALSVKRRLPVLDASSDSPAASFPRWQWGLLQGALMILCWLVLARLSSPLIAILVGRALGPGTPAGEIEARLAQAPASVSARLATETWAMQALLLVAASAVAAFVPGRWGPDRMIVASAVAAGTVVAAAAAGAVLTGGGRGDDLWTVGVSALFMVPCASGAAAVGAWWAAKRRSMS